MSSGDSFTDRVDRLEIFKGALQARVVQLELDNQSLRNELKIVVDTNKQDIEQLKCQLQREFPSTVNRDYEVDDGIELRHVQKGRPMLGSWF